MVLFREEVLKGVFFLMKFEDFLSYGCFRYSIAIGCLEYRDYFRYIFERVGNTGVITLQSVGRCCSVCIFVGLMS
jgi:hypothetical protein